MFRKPNVSYLVSGKFKLKKCRNHNNRGLCFTVITEALEPAIQDAAVRSPSCEGQVGTVLMPEDAVPAQCSSLRAEESWSGASRSGQCADEGWSLAWLMRKWLSPKPQRAPPPLLSPERTARGPHDGVGAWCLGHVYTRMTGKWRGSLLGSVGLEIAILPVLCGLHDLLL